MARRPDHPQRCVSSGQRLWRGFTYRWRFDLWLAGIGAMTLAFSLALLKGHIGPTAGTDGIDSVRAPLVLTALTGVIFLTAGTLTALNYWCAGEPLGSGEGVT